MGLATKGQKKMEYDYDWDDRDNLRGHHAAGAAEAAAEDAWEDEEESE